MDTYGSFSEKNIDGGFSLVELIIVVSILAIAAIPLMKSMTMSSKVNAKAQSIQNATSLGEKVMEQIKSTPAKDLRTLPGWTVSDDGSVIQMESTSPMRATQGEEFDVTVTVDRSSYSGSDTLSETDKAANVSSANTVKLPRIEEIDTLSQAVLSSKELNKYDMEAKNYFNQKLEDYPSVVATIKSKTVNIIKEGVIYPPSIKVTATVSYTDDASPANEYTREIYAGSFVPEYKDGSTTEFKPLDSNIYIFYRRNDTVLDDDSLVIPADLVETINITDNVGYENTEDTDARDSHRLYFIRQDKSDWKGPKLVINGTSFTYSDIGTLTDGVRSFDSGKVQLVTNLDSSDISEEAHIYKEEARIRVYEITVNLYKGLELVTSLNSTVSASDIVTPTPEPTTEP